MADDLMDFSEGDENENNFADNEEQDENIENVPGLLQSPVIVNSILKQSNKDNLIQLFTPVQKPEKGRLKVHFGVDSVLQTPIAKQNKKKQVTMSPAFKEIDKGGDDADSKTDENEDWRDRTSVLTKQDHLDYIQYAHDWLNELVLNLPPKGDFECHDSATLDDGKENIVSQDSYINIQVSESEKKEEKIEPFSSTDLILSQAKELLRSIQESTTTCHLPSAPVMPDKVDDLVDTKVDNGHVPELNVDTMKPLKMKLFNREVTTVAVKNSTGESICDDILCEEEPMDFEEDVGANELKISEDEKLSDLNNQSEEVSRENNQDEFAADKGSHTLDNESQAYVKAVMEKDARNNQDSGSLDVMQKLQEESEVALIDELKNRTSEMVDKDIINECENLHHENYEILSTKVKTTVSYSSDEEFLSADELMEVDDKTPVKKLSETVNTVVFDSPVAAIEVQPVVAEIGQDSLVRIPLKATYNLNFDDLDAVNPFASKKGLANSPEFQNQHKLTSDKETPVEETRDDEHKSVFFNKVEPLTVVAIKNCDSETPESNVPKSEPRLKNESAYIKDMENKCVAENKMNVVVDSIELKGELKSKIKYEENFNSEDDAFKSGFKIVNTPDKSKPFIEDTPTIIFEVDQKPPSSQVIETDVAPKQTEMMKEQQTLATASENLEEALNNNGGKHSVKDKQCEKDVRKPPTSPQKAPSDALGPATVAVVASPPLKTKGLYNLDALDFENMNPFQSSKKLANTSEAKKAKVESESNDCDPKQMNLPEIDHAVSEQIVADSDPFGCEPHIMNKPVCVIKDMAKSVETNVRVMDDELKCVNVTVESKNNETEFEGKKAMTDIDNEFVDVSSSHVFDHVATTTELDLACFDDVNAFNSWQQVHNNNSVVFESSDFSSNNSVLANVDKGNVPCADIAAFDDIDPFKSRTFVKNILPKGVTVKQVDSNAEKSFEMQQKPLDAQTSKPFTDRNLDTLFADFDHPDPFKTSSMLARSDSDKLEGMPFVTKSFLDNTPTKADFEMYAQLTSATDAVRSNSCNLLDTDDFEVQGVTRRGDDMAHLFGQFGDIDESQFVSASQVFNDPASWEMLERFGSDMTNTKESALSRISLYVKFDPLVNAAPANPRRISMRVSQLEKVKEYGLDDTLLLLGTPPKKRRQSINTSHLKHTPSMPKVPSDTQPTTTTTKKVENLPVATGAVDLILAYSPTEKDKACEENGKSFMSLLKETDTDFQQDLFQELKYTDADIRKLKNDMQLALQGELISKEQEICKKEEQWKQREMELLKKLQVIKNDNETLVLAFSECEQTVFQVAAEREKAEKKVAKLTADKSQAMQDIQSVETAFSALLGRYERSKTIITSMQTNEEVMKKYVTECQEKLKKLDEKLHTCEKSSEENLARLQQELDKCKQQKESEQSKSEAQLKMMQMKINTLESTVQRKDEEMKQLTEICNNLLTKSTH